VRNKPLSLNKKNYFFGLLTLQQIHKMQMSHQANAAKQPPNYNEQTRQKGRTKC